MTPKVPRGGRSIRLGGVAWRSYSRVLLGFAEQAGVRLAYDRGELEIVGPSAELSPGPFLGSLVWTLTEELGLALRAGGSTTLRRRAARRGIDPHQCFWIANAHQMAGHRRLDLRTDLAPDVTIEIEACRSSLDRRGIYAALGVPEVWWLARGTLTFFVLDAAGAYAAAPHSKAFPLVTPGDLFGFLRQALQGGDENAVTRQFRQWVRRRHGSGGTPPAVP
jgi:Uma2 family endonuclease